MTAGSGLSHSSSLRGPRGSVSAAADVADDAEWLESPSDLICPITHELFVEPVINAAGQVYERAAIEKALATKLVDPISNLPLPSASLTTVWPMKSKAAAYRERAVQGCIAQVCRPSCRAPVRYLRRAAELAAGALAGVPHGGAVLGVAGLTPEVVDYVLTHPSSIYDFQALSRFAASLVGCGQRERAAALYTQLLQLAGDTSQQVEALQGLLESWGFGNGAGAGGDCCGGEEEEPDEQQLVERLAALACAADGPGDGGYRPARFVGVLLAAGLPEDLVLRFCERILGSSCSAGGGAAAALGFSVGSSSNLANGGAGGAGTGVLCGGSAAVPGPGPHMLLPSSSGRQLRQCQSVEVGGLGWAAAGGAGAAVAHGAGSAGNAELLYVYTLLRCGRLEAAVDALRRQFPGAGGGGAAGDKAGMAAAGGHRFSGSGDGDIAVLGDVGGAGGGGGGGGGRWRFWRRRQNIQRVVCSAVYGLVTLTNCRWPLARVLKVASVLLLLNPQHAR
ncbi:hypothetical protein HYH02_008506 [Chlamydomonas schloesseri]|uniref:U-box domain-containing protein n=1 Tax=Chlamydomonas schloesseri TaxID=2026947 RepID=A0A835WFE2_9CHLO|nr:hypothetical protein HYH02_008506 [Chlamydomonas schloesseri]|eukprot:KAG2446519.1 hypothetical protein HYH02_008506 [Chlamydomonas schloesseri]